MLKYEIYRLKCKKCDNEWDEVANSTTADRFVFSSRMEYLPSELRFDDPFFIEISKIVDEKTENIKKIKNHIGYIFHRILGQVSDQSSDGTHYSMMTSDYKCPRCCSENVDYGPKAPPEFKFLNLSVLPHKKWDSMNDQDKNELIEKLIRNIEKTDK